MGIDLTGIVTPGGAKAKAEVLEDAVVFRGDIKQEVGFEEITAEARGGLLVLSFRGKTVELSAGAKAGALAAKIRSPPSRLDRLGIRTGETAAVAGSVEPAFKAELATRASVASGQPTGPVDVLVFGVEAPAQLDNLARLAPLVAAGGVLWLVCETARIPDSKVAAMARAAGLTASGNTRFSVTHQATRLTRTTGGAP